MDLDDETNDYDKEFFRTYQPDNPLGCPLTGCMWRRAYCTNCAYLKEEVDILMGLNKSLRKFRHE